MRINTIAPFMDMRASRGYVKDVSTATATSAIRDPLAHYNLILDMYRNDEVIATAINTTVDMISRNGYDFVPKYGVEDADDEIKRATKLFPALKFNEVQDKWSYSHLLYGDTFIELRRSEEEFPALKGLVNEGDINELHVLETTEMKIEYDIYGKVTGYWQRAYEQTANPYKDTKKQEMGKRFSPEEVIHSRAITIGSQVYSYTPIEPIARAFANKVKADTYLQEMFDHLPPARLYHLKNANSTQKDAFKKDLMRVHSRTSQDILTYGDEKSDIDFKEITPNFDNGLLTLREQLREQVLMITRVPPVWVGMVNNDGANRGNSEAQIFSYETAVKKRQQQMQDKINQELLPALGFKKIDFVYNPISMKDEKIIMENLAILTSLNVENHRLSRKGILRYLARNGITDFNLDDFIEIKEELPTASTGNQTARNQTSPSRKGMEMKTDTMTNNRGRAGGSEAGEKKRAEQSMRSVQAINTQIEPDRRYWVYDGLT